MNTQEAQLINRADPNVKAECRRIARMVWEITAWRSDLYFQDPRVFEDDKIKCEWFPDTKTATVMVKEAGDCFFCHLAKDEEPAIFRPGKWIGYIERLCQDVERDKKQTTQEAFTPLDDAHIFSSGAA